MDLDQRISKLLDEESNQVDTLMLTEPGVFGMLKATFKGAMRFWMILVYAVGLLAFLVLLWSGYQFFNAEETNELVFWGVILVISLQVQNALKMWTFMEMNRISIMREVKRVEIQLLALKK